MHGDEGYVESAVGEVREEAVGGDVEKLDGLEAGLVQCGLDRTASLEGDLSLVRPSASEDSHLVSCNVRA